MPLENWVPEPPEAIGPQTVSFGREISRVAISPQKLMKEKPLDPAAIPAWREYWGTEFRAGRATLQQVPEELRDEVSVGLPNDFVPVRQGGGFADFAAKDPRSPGVLTTDDVQRHLAPAPTAPPVPAGASQIPWKWIGVAAALYVGWRWWKSR